MLRYRGVLLPTVANPSFPGGGFFGESKAEILALAMRHVPEWVAPFVRGRPARVAAARASKPNATAALARLAAAGIALPVVAKPDLGCRGAGVKLVRNAGRPAGLPSGLPGRGASVAAAAGALRGRGRHLLLPPARPGAGAHRVDHAEVLPVRHRRRPAHAAPADPGRPARGQAVAPVPEAASRATGQRAGRRPIDPPGLCRQPQPRAPSFATARIW